MRGGILVVEDNKVIREIMLRYLNNFALSCHAVETGEEAVELSEQFDLILMDVQLPGISGVEASRRIRQRERQRSLDPVVIVATTTCDNRKECLSAGMDDFYHKPLSREAVANVVEGFIFRP